MSVLTPPAPACITADIEPTGSYARRAYHWEPAGPGRGRLTLTVWKSGRPGSAETAVYEVEETHERDPRGRVFLLNKNPDDPAADTYECFVAADPRLSRCSCTGGNCGAATDKHTDALSDIIRRKGL